MKLRNRIFSLLLVACMLAGLLPVSAIAVGTAQGQAAELPAAGTQTDSPAIAPDALEVEPDSGLVPQVDRPDSILNDELSQILAENQPQAAGGITVTAEETENPGLELKQDLSQFNENLDTGVIAPDETVRVIVVLEDGGLLEQGFSTMQIASNDAKVTREVETLAKRQETMLQSISRVVEEPVEAKYRYNVAVNGLAVEIPYGDLEEIRALPGVKTAFVAPCYDAPEDMTGETVDPNMYAAKNTVGAPQTWEELGYTGAGMRIAIIDSGLDDDHPAFAQAPELTEDSLTLSEVESVMKSLNAYELYMSHTAKELTADRLYRSEKVPFGFNYVDENLELNHDNASAYDHGSHVAGIAAANPVEGSDVVGVSPDAQILVMKVFGKSGGAYFDDILAALEDCYRLNVDVVNLSLGSASGFTDEDDYINEIYGRILESDMVAAISAGNSYSAAYMNAYGTNRNLTQDPDIGVVGSPGTYPGATMVASLENDYLMSTYFTVGEHSITYNDIAAMPFTDLAGEEFAYVLVPGYGAVEDYAGLELTGKVAVVSRGDLSFVEKQQNAAAAGAVALIVYDNTDEVLGYMQDSGLLPNIMITKANGEILKAQAVNGEGTLAVHAADDLIVVESGMAGQMSDFSSWGVTPDLQLMPDVSAPGGNIYSTVDGGGYGTKSGTSMSSPAVAGMSALVLQYLREQYDLYDAQTHTIAEALMMSTAEPVVEPSGVLYSPRKQGAGSANVYRAITSPAYLTVNGETPKVSFGDDSNRTGVYRFAFEVNNLTDEALTYVLDGSALTDQVDLTYADAGYYFMGESSRNLDATVEFSLKSGELPLQYDYNGDGETNQDDVQALLDAVNGLAELQPGYDLTGDGKTDTADAQALYALVSAGFVPETMVEVPANGSVRVHVTVTLSEADKAYMDQYYENGIYVDGFVRLYAQDGNAVDLSLPFMGFYGDWSDARIFDSGWYTSENVEYNRYFNVFFTKISGQDYILGWNPYVTEEYDPSHNVLSPNNDGTQDAIVDIYLSLMRNAKRIGFTWENTKTNRILYEAAALYARKSVFNGAYNLCLPMIASQYFPMYDFRGLSNNDELQLTIDAYLDDGDDVADEIYTMPVYIDTEAPVLHTDSLQYDYDPATDTRKLSFDVSDNHGIAAVIPLTEGDGIYERIAVDDRPGEKTHIELDVTDYDASFVIAVCDYGCNERYYKITFFGEENVDFDTFYGYRCAATLSADDGSTLTTDMFNGWVSFETGAEMFQHTAKSRSGEADVYAAEYIDGYIIGIDANSNIFTMRAGDWGRTVIGKLEVDGQTYQALDMAFDYTTDTLFVLTDELELNRGGHLMTVDYLTGEVTDIGIVEDDNPKANQGIVLACDNQGVLYTVYAMGSGSGDVGGLYTIDKETAFATRVGGTGLLPEYVQSMTVDHETDKLYWASSQGTSAAALGNFVNSLYEVNKTTGELTLVSEFQYSDEITGLIKPYRSEKNLIPDDAQLTGLQLSKNQVTLVPGQTEDLTCRPWPYYAALGDVTWTSSNPAVATVENGAITAVAQGDAVITASVGGLTVTCPVSVKTFSGELNLFSTVENQWITVDLSDPGTTRTIEGAASFPYGFIAAAYYDGNLCVTDYLNGFYRLDGETLQGVKIGDADRSLSGMAFNYQDGFVYGFGGSWLCRVDPYSGATAEVTHFNSSLFGQPMGGMAIDRDGNFYCITRGLTGEGTMLQKFRLEDGQAVDWQTASLAEYPIQMYTCSLTYSPANGGLFWANEMGQLLWIDASDMENLKIAELGRIGNTTGGGSYAMNTCLYEIPEDEPEIPYAPITGASMEDDSYTLVVGGAKRVGLSGEPWNAKLEATYAVDDTSIAVVDEHGELTGVSVGETTLRVYVQGLDQPLEAPVKVVSASGEIYGYMLGNYMYDWGKWFRFQDSDTGNIERLAATDGFFQVRAGAYYNGSIYTYSATEQDENWKRSIVKFDSGDYSKQTLKFSDYQIRDMEFDYTTGTMYAVAESIATNAAGDYALIQVDVETGDEVLVGNTGQDLVAMTVDNLGRIFGINQNGDLCRVDKETGAATVVGPTGANAGSAWQSMHYDYNSGNTYWAEPGEGGYLRLVDLETGESTPVGVIEMLGMQMSAMYTIPEVEPAIPEIVEPAGVSLEEKNTVAVGNTVALTARVLPLTVAQMDETLTWTSSDEAIATVENGVVTGVSAGTVTITATTVNGRSAECTVVVTENERRFYAYDEDNAQWISFTAENPEDVTVERKDAEGETPISASAYTGETIYAFDSEGRFYTIDPETFVRTKVSDALYGTIVTLRPDGLTTLDCNLMPVDMSYDAATGKLYLVCAAYMYTDDPVTFNKQGFGTLFYEVTPETGETALRCQDQTFLPGNLLVENGRMFFVNAFLSGMFSYIDLSDWRCTVVQQGLIVDYWGLFMHGRGMVRDDYTGTVYAIYDQSDLAGDDTGGRSQLVVLNMNNPDITKLGIIGGGIVANSLFIR